MFKRGCCLNFDPLTLYRFLISFFDVLDDFFFEKIPLGFPDTKHASSFLSNFGYRLVEGCVGYLDPPAIFSKKSRNMKPF